MITAIVFFLSCNSVTEKTNEKALGELGHYLFFDTRLSFNGSKSCASCHAPKFAFSDGYRKSITATGDVLMHNSPSLINSSALFYYDWANNGVRTLFIQSNRPLFGKHPVELGANIDSTGILTSLKRDSLYQKLFAEAFQGKAEQFSFDNIRKALAAYVSSLQSLQSPYDRFIKGNENAISVSAKKGMELFFSQRLKCGNCHPAPYFTNAAMSRNPDSVYFNIGLYNHDSGWYAADDQGLYNLTKNKNDIGKFKVPSLRNLAFTAPYTHDGSVNSIEEMIGFYARGGRNVTYGPYAGDGKDNPYKHIFISGFEISESEKKQLSDFLFALTDSTVLTNPHFQDPFLIENK